MPLTTLKPPADRYQGRSFKLPHMHHGDPYEKTIFEDSVFKSYAAYHGSGGIK